MEWLLDLCITSSAHDFQEFANVDKRISARKSEARYMAIARKLKNEWNCVPWRQSSRSYVLFGVAAEIALKGTWLVVDEANRAVR